MKYYHVILAWKSGGSSSKEVFSDLSLCDLNRKFVKPYLHGQHILAGNEQIDVFEISKVMILRTDERSAIARERINEESFEQIRRLNAQGGPLIISAGSGYGAEDLVEAGTDVTKDFITGSVGSKKSQPWYISLLLTVLAGVLIGGIVWWMGWR